LRDFAPRKTLPEFTGSLDAAASLRPEGWTGIIYLDGKAGLYRDDSEATMDGLAFTPALALCAAALRARAATIPEERA
jgi:hypothetical protein